MSYVILFRIGDWSGDGHGHHKEFFVSCNKTLSEVQDAYRKAKKNLDQDIHPTSFMNGYQERSLDQKIYEKALAAGFDFFERWRDDADFKDRLDSGELFEYPGFGPEAMLEYTLWFIRQGDRGLEFEVAGIPIFDTGDGFIGYGLFE